MIELMEYLEDTLDAENVEKLNLYEFRIDLPYIDRSSDEVAVRINCEKGYWIPYQKEKTTDCTVKLDIKSMNEYIPSSKRSLRRCKRAINKIKSPNYCTYKTGNKQNSIAVECRSSTTLLNTTFENKEEIGEETEDRINSLHQKTISEFDKICW